MQIFPDTSLFCLQTAKSIVFWRGKLSPFLPEDVLNAHMDPTAAQPRSSKQRKAAGRPGDTMQTSASAAARFALLQGYVLMWILSLCVSVTPCLGEIPLANTPTQTAHTVGLTAAGTGEGTSSGEKKWRLGGSWLWIPYTAATVTELHVGFCNFRCYEPILICCFSMSPPPANGRSEWVTVIHLILLRHRVSWEYF